ncbi:hypothetical protein [Haloarcula marismortui]|uniref:hypothetical protein n=1 Tax=Haloarcula marismortui TaxID=2238 RepID=UPI001268046E|nr:hypothetical protein [Haloarcula californiae]
MVSDDIPEHLTDGPVIEEDEFIISTFSKHEVTEIHTAISELHEEVRESENEAEDRYLVLGNYEENKKKRLKQASTLLEYFNPRSVSFLLSDLDSNNDN